MLHFNKGKCAICHRSDIELDEWEIGGVIYEVCDDPECNLTLRKAEKKVQTQIDLAVWQEEKCAQA